MNGCCREHADCSCHGSDCDMHWPCGCRKVDGQTEHLHTFVQQRRVLRVFQEVARQPRIVPHNPGRAEETYDYDELGWPWE